MYRRLFVLLFRRSLIATLLFCLGCAAQSTNPDLNQRIERQVRAFFNIPPNVQITVGPRSPSSDFPNYDQVTITFAQEERKQTHDFLLSKDGKTLVNITKLDIAKDPYAEIMSKINIDGRPVRGNKDAKVTIVNFDDFQCPFCSRMHRTLMGDILKAYGDRIKIIYKDYPLAEIHPWAIHAAVDANCLAQQSADAYWDYADTLHSNPVAITGGPDKKLPFADQVQALDRTAIEVAQRRSTLDLAKVQSCIKAQDDAPVRASMKEGNALGINATPTMFINGSKVDGAVPASDLRAMIDRALRDAGQPVPAPAATAAK